MFDGVQLDHQILKAAGRKHKRIAARQNNLPDFGMIADIGQRPPGDHLGEILAVLPLLLAVLPQVVGGVDAGAGIVHAPIEDVRVVVDTAGHKAVPAIEAVLVRARALGQAEVPLAGHIGLVVEFFELAGDGRGAGWQTGGGAVAGED